MYDTSDIRKGLKVRIDGQPYVVVDHQFVKPGKGQAFTRTRLKNMITGSVLDRTFKSGEKLEKADLDERQMQYLYPEGDRRVFMDTQTYDQISLSDEQLAENVNYLLDGSMVDVLFYEGKPIDITPPMFVELKVSETDPGFKGDTTTGGTKPAKLETGYSVNVPLFINEGDVLKIDTRTGSYVERVKTG
ncbi:MAG: elongation factor P [Myxococcota bacterium]